MSKHVALTYIPMYIKINVAVLTDVLCLYVMTLRDGKIKKIHDIPFVDYRRSKCLNFNTDY